ncbi:MAG: hypothetical protein ABSA67_18970 [Candidatus Brocadiia bacterium]|jgi:hypothetical protein
MFLVIDSLGNLYTADELIPGTGEVFTDMDGLLDASAYTTTADGDDTLTMGAQT